ncbi:alpha/beta fold hydrolase [Herpetosiphon llansteffanensis]|uniref:alpha/beta fold hydrolase n=1 Tax=Herpetosiphon llansteffanensis TaxID=2094568 RepID=UPI000D7BAE87|nr:alpha/beta hydrolase [Herpetosiphon llansteffanensis]
MSAIFIENRVVHYEVFGRGQPIIFLHSWLGSWRYWMPSMEMVSDRFRTYALDFWGFGDSDRTIGTYNIDAYVEQLLAFMRELGMVRTNLVGHGLGGMVAIRAAAQAPNSFIKVITSNMPVYGEPLSSLVKPSTLSRLMGKANPTETWNKLLKNIKIDDDTYREVLEDTNATAGEVIQRVFDSVLAADLRSSLETLKTPTLGIYSGNDQIVARDHAQLFENAAIEHQVLTLENSTHFPFLEINSQFNRLILDFFTSRGANTVQIKEEWRRRMSQFEYL